MCIRDRCWVCLDLSSRDSESMNGLGLKNGWIVMTLHCGNSNQVVGHHIWSSFYYCCFLLYRWSNILVDCSFFHSSLHHDHLASVREPCRSNHSDNHWSLLSEVGLVHSKQTVKLPQQLVREWMPLGLHPLLASIPWEGKESWKKSTPKPSREAPSFPMLCSIPPAPSTAEDQYYTRWQKRNDYT